MVKECHIREPGFNERYYIARNMGNYYTNFNIIAKYSKRVTSELLSNALTSLIKRNSWLTYNFYKIDESDDSAMNGTNYIIRPVNKIKFEDVVSFQQVQTFDKSLFEQVNGLKCPMNLLNLPLWRMIVFESSNGDQYICVYCDHSLYDGLSAVEFHKDLVVELSKASEEKVEYIFDYERDINNLPCKILSACEYRTNLFDPSFFQVFKFYLKKLLPRFLLNTFNFVKGLLINRVNDDINPIFSHGIITKDLNSKFRIMNFTPDQVHKISQYCKSNNITMTPYFNIIALECLEKTFLKNLDDKTSFSTTSLIAVNGRRYYPEHMKKFLYGVMVSGDMIHLPPLHGGSITHMKYVHERILKNLKSRFSFKLIGMHKYLNLWDFLRSKMNRKDGRFTLLISNLGKIKNEGSSFVIEDVYFGSNTGILYHFIINMTTTEKCGLNVVLSYLSEYDALFENDKKVIDIFVEQFYNSILNFPNEN